MLAIILGTTTSRPSTRTPATVTAGQDPVRHQRRQPSPTHQQIARKLPLGPAGRSRLARPSWVATLTCRRDGHGRVVGRRRCRSSPSSTWPPSRITPTCRRSCPRLGCWCASTTPTSSRGGTTPATATALRSASSHRAPRFTAPRSPPTCPTTAATREVGLAAEPQLTYAPWESFAVEQLGLSDGERLAYGQVLADDQS